MSIHPTFTEAELTALRSCNPSFARARIRTLSEAAAKEAGVSIAHVMGCDRHAATVRVRDVVILKCSREGIPDAVIASALGMDQSSVHTARKREIKRRGEA